MYLLKYTNTTNPTAPILGACILSEAEKAAFELRVAEIKSRISDTLMFIFPVGAGYIPYATSGGIDYSITEVSQADEATLSALGDTGFARHFVDGVLNYTEQSFITVAEEVA